MRAGPLLCLPLLLGAAPDPRAQLRAARAAAAAAEQRAAAIQADAGRENDAAVRARKQEAAVAASIDAAQADVRAGEARVALVAARLAAQQAVLAERQAPVARLLGALASLARRPAVVAVAQPGQIDDLVHVRAVLGGTLPLVRARTAGLRGELAATRKLRADAALAVDALSRGRAELEGRRAALLRLEAEHSRRSLALGRRALAESDRAIAMGERARDLADRIAAAGGQRATAAGLARLAGPPDAPSGATGPGAYRLPVRGRLVTGTGEVSAAGVRARGLTWAVAPGVAVVAPAAGRVVFARRFRGYRTVVVIDHGAGWTTLLAGLGGAAVRVGETVAAGTLIGRAPDGDEPEVTAELRRRGRPVDLTALL
jgi:murein hydrolase activator